MHFLYETLEVVIKFIITCILFFLSFFATYEILSSFTKNSVPSNSFLSLIVAICLFIILYRYFFLYCNKKDKKKDKKNLLITAPLSVYDDRVYEYLVGSVLIYLDIVALGVEESEKRLNEDICTIMHNDNIEKAMLIAEEESRKEYPNEWQSHYKNGVKESPLELWSVYYNTVTREFNYKFYLNNNYPVLKDEFQFSNGDLLSIVSCDEIKDLIRINC